MLRKSDHETLKLFYYIALTGILIMIIHHTSIIHVMGTSMYPTLKNDTYALGTKSDTYEMGDIVILEQEPTGSIIKRVIGVAGDHVVMNSKATYVNGKRVFKDLENTPSGLEVDTIVPDNCIFVVGDNRADSWDSRYFGAVSLDSVKYKLASVKCVSKFQYVTIVVISCYSVTCLFMIDDVVRYFKKIIRKVKRNG